MTDLRVPDPVQYADVAAYMSAVGRTARSASFALARASTRTKNAALNAIAGAIRRESAAILAANAEDVATAHASGHDAAFIDRLTLAPTAVETIAAGVDAVTALA